MTYYETLYFWSFLMIPILFLIISIITDDSELMAIIPAGWLLLLMGGGAAMCINMGASKYVQTSIVETVPVSTTLTNFGLDVVTDENEMIRFTEYKDIQSWKDEAKLYKIYYHKKCNFGPDEDKREVLFRKVEK